MAVVSYWAGVFVLMRVPTSIVVGPSYGVYKVASTAKCRTQNRESYIFNPQWECTLSSGRRIQQGSADLTRVPIHPLLL